MPLYRRPQRTTLLATLLVVGLVAPAFLFPHGPSDRERVEAYCAYGARSAAQWRGCVDHVTIGQVRSRDTRAARFALDGGKCPRSTYCAAWQESVSYCADVEPVSQTRCRAALAAPKARPPLTYDP